MPTLVTRLVLAGTHGEVSAARREVIDQVRAWDVPLDDETADTIRLVASELITNAVVHGGGPIIAALHHRPVATPGSHIANAGSGADAMTSR
ncbi:ATP-binding protein [Streptomyces zagrosensis]|uniref:Anti-sigma regulatory factor (Ser/Thr protein kinase) n=1 Tax=Streptomyces zagrosensis TaxID=1042984 RepID=A0A7W9Q870_9ACTN|nr:hypothetical protein [Streptomyces zagrosensis]MBB5934342.1 anti-sigma regulatory factor (Ser/Thr protein kinase) [Streptomyces zagrosensis]